MSATPRSAPDRETLPSGLVLFPPGTDPRRKRRRLLFAAFYALVVASVLWPIYRLFSGIHPMILGLPLSLAWVVLALVAGFVALLALYATEEDSEEKS